MVDSTPGRGATQAPDEHCGPQINRDAVVRAISQWSLCDDPQPLRALAVFGDGSGDLGRLVKALQPELDRETPDPFGAMDRFREAGELVLVGLLDDLIGEMTRMESMGEEPSPPADSWPAPPDTAAFQGFAGDIVETIAPTTESDPVAILGQLLAAFGSAVGRGPHHIIDGARHGTNLFVVLVGETSKGRKGTSWSRVIDLFQRARPEGEEWMREHVVSGLSSGEGLIWAVRDPITKCNKEGDEEVTDEGVEDKRLLVVEAEYARTLRVLGREGNTLSGVVRCAWDHGDLRSLVKQAPARATGAHISIVAHVVAEELRRYLSESEVAGGWGNRFIHLCAQRKRVLPEGGELPEVDQSRLAQGLIKALLFGQGIGSMVRDEEARREWYQVYEALSEGRPGLLGAILARSEAQVLRVSMVYALLDRSSVICARHQRAALALWEYADASARYVWGDALGDVVADTILEEFRAAGTEGLDRTEISRILGRNRPAREIDRALALLERLRLARKEFDRSAGGRPREVWYAV